MGKVLLKDGRELSIRPAAEGDAAEIIEYVNLVGGESDFLTFGKNGFRFDLEQEKQFLRDVRSSPADLYLVGFVGDELACTANLASERKSRIAHNCEIGITVREKYWHLGAASALLGELIRFARDGGTIRTIHLGVYGRNGRAIRLYEKFGFEAVGRHRDYFCVDGVYDDEILMDLHL